MERNRKTDLQTALVAVQSTRRRLLGMPHTERGVCGSLRPRGRATGVSNGGQRGWHCFTSEVTWEAAPPRVPA